jgi:hypothetical protein
MSNTHNTRRVTGGQGTAAGNGLTGQSQNTLIPPNPVPLIPPNPVPVNPVIIAFNPVYLAQTEQDAEDLMYLHATVADLAIVPGEPLEMMRVKARQLKRKREAASVEELERAKLLMYAADSLKELGQVEAATFSKYVFTDLDGKDEFIKNYSKGVEILASSNQLRRLGSVERNKIWIGDNSTVLSESRILGDIEYRVKTDNFESPFQSLEMWNSLKDIRIMQRSNFKFLLSLACDHLSPEGLNLAMFLPVGEELDNFSALLTALSGLDDVFTAFYDPIWTGCADAIKNKLKTSTVRNSNFTLVRDLLECQFRHFCTQIVTKNTIGTIRPFDSSEKCKLLFIDLMVLDEAHLTERRERIFLSQKLATYLHPINDKRSTTSLNGHSILYHAQKGTKSILANVVPTAHVPAQVTGAKAQRVTPQIQSKRGTICLFHMLDFFKINSSVGNPLGPCTKRSTCRLEHPKSGPVGRVGKDLWIKSVQDSRLFYAKDPAILKKVLDSINACP